VKEIVPKWEQQERERDNTSMSIDKKLQIVAVNPHNPNGSRA
jgi:hypothetical protein